MPPPDTFVIIALAVLVGTIVQGCVGLGLGLVAAPVTALVEPALMPGMLLWLTLVLPMFTVAREWAEIDWWGLRWALLGRLPATAVGASIVALVSTKTLSIMVGLVILLAVVLTARTVRLPMRASVLVGAGVISGVSGTATSIGGPPLALVYQRELGPKVRATLAIYFIVGVTVSLFGLAMVDELTMRQATTALWLMPLVAVGFGLSVVLRSRIDGTWLRRSVLVVCALSALALLARSLAA